MIRITYRVLLIVLAAALVSAIALQAGLTRAWFASIGIGASRAIQLRVWDWWSPSGNEAYGAYFASVKETFERRHPDVEIVYQIVPFGHYVQKLATAMIGQSPPDVFQSSVFWAEGFYQRGMLRPLRRRRTDPNHVGPHHGLRRWPCCRRSSTRQPSKDF